MEDIIGLVIGIPLLLFALYLCLAIPYSTIIKPLYKTIKASPKAFKNTSAKLQSDNVRRTLQRLVDTMEMSLDFKKNNKGKFLQADLDKVTKIQKELLTDMIGPLSKSQLKKELFDPYFKSSNFSKETKIGLNHVLKNFSDNKSLIK